LEPAVETKIRLGRAHGNRLHVAHGPSHTLKAWNRSMAQVAAPFSSVVLFWTRRTQQTAMISSTKAIAASFACVETHPHIALINASGAASGRAHPGIHGQAAERWRRSTGRL